MMGQNLLSFVPPKLHGASRRLSGLAEHIVQTGGLLCSSCQVIYLDTGHLSVAERFCKQFLPVLEKAAASHYKTPGQAAQAALYARETALEQTVDRTGSGDLNFPGQNWKNTRRKPGSGLRNQRSGSSKTY